MTSADQIKLLCIVGPIIGLLVMGFLITARSGVVRLTSGPGARLLVENVSKTILLVVACLLAMLLVQQFLGFPFSLLR